MDYSNAKIYKIIDNTNGDVYIGSTCLPLEKRLKQHQKNYKYYLNEKYSFVTSFKILENNDYSIELLEEFACESKIELHERERYHIENNKCVNRNIPNRTDKEYYQDNKGIISEKNKQYKQDNIEKITQQFTCECGGKYQYNDRARHFRTGKHQKYINSLSEINLEK
jgi:hypothetical protein